MVFRTFPFCRLVGFASPYKDLWKFGKDRFRPSDRVGGACCPVGEPSEPLGGFSRGLGSRPVTAPGFLHEGSLLLAESCSLRRAEYLRELNWTQDYIYPSVVVYTFGDWVRAIGDELVTCIAIANDIVLDADSYKEFFHSDAFPSWARDVPEETPNVLCVTWIAT
eukprot:374012-Prorocentrum_minimum.AAC.1